MRCLELVEKYDATTARWWVQDTKAEKYYSLTPYSYVAGNPVGLIDPDGMDFEEWTKERRQEDEELDRQMDQSYLALMTRGSYDKSMSERYSPSTDETVPDDPPKGKDRSDEPFVKVRLDIKIGLGLSEKVKVLGLGEELNLSLISINYMTFEWDSENNKIIYLPYSGISSGFSLGAGMYFTGISKDWEKKGLIPSLQTGMIYMQKGQSPTIHALDIGYMWFGNGFDFNVSVNSKRFFNFMSNYNSQIKYPYYPFLH